MKVLASMDIDANFKAITSPLPFRESKRMTLAGGTTNDPGDIDGTGNPATLFTVTGDVLVYIIGICKTDLAGAGTLEIGVLGNTAILLPQIADATTLDKDENYLDATPAIGEGQAPVLHPISGGLDIIQTTGSVNITAGVVDYYCFWRPLSVDGLVVAA